MDSESFLDMMERINAVFNLSETGHFMSPHESENNETDSEDGNNPNSNSANSDGEKETIQAQQSKHMYLLVHGLQHRFLPTTMSLIFQVIFLVPLVLIMLVVVFFKVSALKINNLHRFN